MISHATLASLLALIGDAAPASTRGAADIGIWSMAAAYLLLIIPLAILLHLGVPIIRETGISIARMTQIGRAHV